MRPQRFDCSAIIPTIAPSRGNTERHSVLVGGFLGKRSRRVPGWHPARHPKIGVRLGRSGAAQILRNSIDTYPRRLSGHQLFENGRSGYADEEDHE